MKRWILFVLVTTTIGPPAQGADAINKSSIEITKDQNRPAPWGFGSPIYRGVVAVIDGQTVWYPRIGQTVRLAQIDGCPLPQWAFVVRREGETEDRKTPPPVPCGAFAKAWLKRTVNNRPVEWTIVGHGQDGSSHGRCTVDGRDVALEMLRVGWARISSSYPAPASYLAYQSRAMSAGYGMWSTSMLDGDEWRRLAVDRTLARRPVADAHLLARRGSEKFPFSGR